MSSLTTSHEGESSTPRFFVGTRDDETDFLGSNMKTDEIDFFEDDEESESPPERQIVVGICAMTKKSKSKPMTQILERLCKFEYITVVIMGEDVILNEPVENWPSCDCLISFHSKGFPLDKAVAYAKLCNPFLINDLDMQYYIQDRREVYRILQEEGIDLPRYAVLNRDPDKPDECNLVEGEDQVEVNGAVFPKPFVEKPVSAEDHNVYIYYPTSAGGGSQRLFRKIGSRSSVYSPESSVRKTGSYIYEEFMPTDGTDVKVYTVGPDYAHAEARKSPALDGKVERDSEGKEIRYPVMLTAMEKLVARKVCVAFKQTVCGFDLLRANGHSFVCDVNGFSFVKNSMKYYDDCAKILGNIIMRELAPQFQIPWSIPTEAEDIPIVPTTSGTMMELRCVIAVIRHGDRTPKQKMKMEVKHSRFFELFEKYDGYKTGKLKLKKPEQLQEVLDIARLLVVELGTHNDCEIEERKSKLEQLKTVLEMYGHFSGINRKVQLTYLPRGHPKASSEDEDARKEPSPSLLLVLKWGGELTPAGRVQAEELGRAFRCMYPGGQGDYAGFPGCGLLRLHSTYRHDLKIYASDEGRVQMTAAAFAKGLLALEGELTPILVQMVKSANMNGLLDSDSDSLSSCQHRVKARLHEIMQKDAKFCEGDYEKLAPTGSISLVNSMTFIQNPVEICDQVFALIENLTSQICKRLEDPKSADLQLYHSETLELMLQRWSKLERDFRMKNGRYDISKIPDIYDCIKYDVQHNCTLKLEGTAELFKLSKALADVIIPQEYGINKEEKLEIAIGFCLPLIKKIQLDLQRTHEDESVNKLHPLYSRGVLSPGRHVRTRLYFTSESHVHSLLSIFRYGGLLDESKDQQWKRAMDYLSAISELNYMTQIVIMLYEDNNKDPSSEERFHVELHFSPGVKGCEEDGSAPTGFGFRPASAENDDKKPNQGSMEDLSKVKSTDETDQAQERSSQPSEPICVQRRSPLIRNRKTGSMEVLSESSSKTGGYRLFSSYSRQSAEMKQSGLGSQCTGLFSTTVLGGSSSAPNLQDYARSHGKKFAASLTYKDGFEGCSMVPTIYPLETLHNSLSLRQVNEFLTSVCRCHSNSHSRASTALFDSVIGSQTPGDPFMPQRILSSSSLPLRQRSDKPPWYSSGPSSTVSSAGPSSPTSMENYARFGFTEKPSISPQISEERLNCQPPEQREMEPSGEARELELGGSGPLVENPLGEMPEQGLMRMPGLLEVPEPSKEEPSAEVPEQGTMGVLELGKTRQSGETSEKDGSVVLEQGEEKPAGGTWELGETGKLEPGEIELSGKISDPGEEGPSGEMLEPDVIRPVIPVEMSELGEEEPVMQTLEPSEEGQPVQILEKEEEELSTDNALSDQHPSSHPYQDQQLSSEKSVEDEQPSRQQELQN
ncbi:inositol hexakisphosphate and diphosphoinositol-pentakisphosphate kinase 1 isoform X7 [Chrysemys picta bellii]|uniref:inositol hexakisphosphate and diphosphoinositol-pentakisphosphate kinase 1 isoform X7 n=1 Tax=Chrysemys picta bellii TaxID=8478 RepID=UPI000388B678|nr:inositol hexakisphosphate and diphosphoinositol-pentakisphosphate kinase 1 isoform X4 [Chrysemys picta bellii]